MSYHHSMNARIQFKSGVSIDDAMSCLAPLSDYFGWTRDEILAVRPSPAISAEFLSHYEVGQHPDVVVSCLEEENQIEIHGTGLIAGLMYIHTSGSVGRDLIAVVEAFAEKLCPLAEPNCISVVDHDYHDPESATSLIWYGNGLALENAKREYAWSAAANILRQFGTPEETILAMDFAKNHCDASHGTLAAPAEDTSGQLGVQTGGETRTIVDDFVKAMMLHSFDSFPTRNHVLSHVFLTVGNGYEWALDQSGYMVPTSDFPTRVSGGISPVEGVSNVGSSTIFSGRVLVANRVNVEFQNMVRAWARKNIDVISTEAFRLSGQTLRPVNLFPASSYCLLAEAPPAGTMHPEWREAAVQFALDTLVQIRSITSYCGEYEALLDFLKANHTALVGPAVVCKAALDKLQDKEQLAIQIAIVDGIITEILAEENNASDDRP